MDLAYLVFLVRGGLTTGKLYHTGKHVVGPAMIEAYRLESQVAQVPRVVIDEKLLVVARKYRDEMHSEEDEADYASYFMTRDQDGQFFFDYVSHGSVVGIVGGDPQLYSDYLDRLRQSLIQGLAPPQLTVRAKYVWLHRQYQAVIEQVESLPDDDSFRIDELEMFQDIVSLPKLTAEAAAVRAEAVAMELPVAKLY